MMTRRGIAAMAMAALALAGCSGKQGAAIDTGAGADWLFHAGGVDESGFSRLDEIDADSIDRLGLAWSLDLPGEVTLQATPLAVDGVLYFTGTYSAVYAVDAATGRLLWRHDPEIWKHEPERLRLNFAANRGVAHARGRIFVTTYDGRMIALDAKTGKPVWTTPTLPPGSAYFSTGAPLAFGNLVMIGNGGGDYGSRGYVTAYDQATGRQVWRFYTVPGSPEENRGDPAMEAAAKTWSGEYWKTGTGGTAWNSMIYDPELDRVYIGTGNSGPYDPQIRSPGDGDNLYLVSIVALDAKTGKYVWHYQQNPREAWDYKSTAPIVSATLPIEGKLRKVLLHAPTNGFFYVLDRETGRLISAEKTGKVTWAERIDLKTGRPVERPGIRYENASVDIYPGPAGRHNWQQMAFSPQTGLVYMAVQNQGIRFARSTVGQSTAVNPAGAMTLIDENPDDRTGWLLAWDPVRQKEAWKVKLPTFWNGGALATAGGLVFQGAADGFLRAHDERDGKRLWQFNAGHGFQAAPISYAVNGRQYVAILSGYGGAAPVGGNNVGWKYSAPRRLLAFTLDGNASLPAVDKADTTIQPLDDPAMTLAEADVQAGAGLYVACSLCHGKDAVAGGTAPDLRESAIALDAEAFASVVRGGALLPNGMPRYDAFSDAELRQLRAYVRARAREALGKRGDTPKSQPARF